MSELIAANAEAAIASFAKAEEVHLERNDLDAAAWARLFSGKAVLKHRPALAELGRSTMIEAAKVILEVGKDWEQEEIPKILAAAGIRQPE